MLEQIPLRATLRSATGKEVSGRLRRSGQVPAVVYGGDAPNVNVQLAERELVAVLRAAEKKNVIVQLSIEGEPAGEKLVLVKARQFHPVDSHVLHVDFYRVALSDTIDVRIPVVTTGIPQGVKDGGVVVHNLREIAVRGKLSDIPDRVSVEIGSMTIGASLHVSDLTVPAGIQVMTRLGEAVVSVSVPTELKEGEGVAEVAAVVPEALQPEVIGEKERLERQAAKAGGKPEAGKADEKKEAAPKAEAGKKEAAKPAAKDSKK